MRHPNIATIIVSSTILWYLSSLSALDAFSNLSLSSSSLRTSLARRRGTLVARRLGGVGCGGGNGDGNGGTRSRRRRRWLPPHGSDHSPSHPSSSSSSSSFSPSTLPPQCLGWMMCPDPNVGERGGGGGKGKGERIADPTSSQDGASSFSYDEKDDKKEKEDKDKDAARNEVKYLNEMAQRASLEAQKLEAELTLDKIGRLERAVLLTMSSDSPDSGGGGGDKRHEKKVQLRAEIESLAKKIDPTIVMPSSKSPSPLPLPLPLPSPSKGSVGVDAGIGNGTGSGSGSGVDTSKPNELTPSTTAETEADLTEKELRNAAAYFDSLPKAMRIALAEIVFLNPDYDDTDAIVTALYERTMRNTEVTSGSSSSSLSLLLSAASEAREIYSELLAKPTREDVQSIMAELEDTIVTDASVDSLIPRQCMKDGCAPSASDVDAFFTKVCGKGTFLPSEKPIRAGEIYIIRGTNTQKSANDLIDALTAKVETEIPSWSKRNVFCYVTDPTLREGVEDEFGDPVLLIANVDMSPTANRLLILGSTFAGLIGSFLFALAAFGSNPVVMNRLKEASDAISSDSGVGVAATTAASGGTYDLSWFNDLLFPLIASIAAIQFCHEMGHQVVAWRDGMKVTPPTILPSAGLPYLTSIRRIKVPPKSFKSLFDFGFAGPAAGLVASMTMLLWGLALTTTVDSETAMYLPSLPVAFVKLSTLGGTIVDQVLGGGTGMLLSQDVNAQIPLHPFAIAGFTGLMINALDLIPIGASDGARVMQSILGRVGQTVVSGFAYFAILFALIFIDDQRDIVLSFAIITTLVQRDLEIPCRNEIDKVGLSRATAALAAFFLAALILVPMS